MPPKLILVRHAEGEHNATKDYHLHDPLLTATGHEQCAKLNEHLMKNEPLAKEIEVVICSPMRRTIQTMIGGLKGVLEREGVRVEMDAGWQGMFQFTLDTVKQHGANTVQQKTQMPPATQAHPSQPCKKSSQATQKPYQKSTPSTPPQQVPTHSPAPPPSLGANPCSPPSTPGPKRS